MLEERDGDVSIPLLDTTENAEREYVCAMYAMLLERNHRTRDVGLYENDFWYSMFCVHERYWWMARDHPYVEMIEENNDNNDNAYPMAGEFTGSLGKVAVYDDSVVRECIKSLIRMCIRYELKVN